MEKINIDKMYLEKKETSPKIRQSIEGVNYDHALVSVLDSVFSLGQLKSLADLGCRTGTMISRVEELYGLEILGVDYFSWALEYAPKNALSSLKIFDLRDQMEGSTSFQDLESRYDIVTSTEVGEHLEKEFTSVYLNNIRYLAKKYVVMSWSKHPSISNGQHLNPLSNEDFYALMIRHNFTLDEEKTTAIRVAAKTFELPDYYIEGALSVWKI